MFRSLFRESFDITPRRIILGLGLFLVIFFGVRISAASAFTCTAVAGGGNWSSAATWSGCNSTIPQAGDDVVLNATSGNVVVDTNSNNLNSFDASAYTGTLSGASSITVAPSTGSTVTKFGGTLTWTGTLNLNPASTATTTLTSNGKTLNAVTVAAASGAHVVFGDGLNVGSNAITLTSGYLHVDGASDSSGLTHTWGSFVSSVNNVRSLFLGNAVITCSINGTSWNVSNGVSSNFSVNAGNSTIVLTGSSNVFAGSGNGTYYNLTMSGSNASIGGANAFTGTVLFNGSGAVIIFSGAAGNYVNLSRIGTSTKTDTLQINRAITITGVLTVAGNSASNRILVFGGTLGTPLNITLSGGSAAVSASNADFRDIVLLSVGGPILPMNLSTIPGGSGDALGNSGITFTPSQTNYWVGNGGSWSDVNHWANTSGGTGSTGRVPLPQDDVRFDANSVSLTGQVISQDMPRMGRSIDWTGTLNSPSWKTNLVSSGTNEMYGSLTMYPTGGASTGSAIGMYCRTTCSVKSGGKISTSIFSINAYGGVVNLLDDLIASELVPNFGTFNSNGFTVTVSDVKFNNSIGPKIINMGSSLWNLNGTGTVWVGASGGGTTINPGSSTMLISNTSATTKTFLNSMGSTYNNITIPGSGGSVTFSSAVTANKLTIGFPKTVIFTANTTNTFSQFIAKGSSGNLITLQSSTPGTKYTLVQKSGFVSSDWMSITDSTATGGAGWFAGTNSTLSNSTGWQLLTGPAQRGLTLQNGKIKIQKGKVKFQFR